MSQVLYLPLNTSSSFWEGEGGASVRSPKEHSYSSMYDYAHGGRKDAGMERRNSSQLQGDHHGNAHDRDPR